jgi:hypothetical protein
MLIAQTAADSFHWGNDLLVPLLIGAVGGTSALTGQWLLLRTGLWHQYSGRLWEQTVVAYREFFSIAFNICLEAATNDDRIFSKGYMRFQEARGRFSIICADEVAGVTRELQDSLNEVSDALMQGNSVPDKLGTQLFGLLEKLIEAIRNDLAIAPLSEKSKNFFGIPNRTIKPSTH